MLCAIHSKFIHSALAPWCLAVAVEQRCGDAVSVRVVEGTINETDEVLLGRMLGEKPDVIGLSCYIWNIETIKRLTAEIRRCAPETVLVLGGPEVSYNPEEVLEACPEVNWIVAGEGEGPFTDLIQTMLEGYGVPESPGVLRAATPEADGGSPYSDAYFASLRGRIAYLETSRGCPYRCAFCLSGRCGGVRYFEMERVKREIRLLAESGAKTVKFVDRTFNASERRAAEIVRWILALALSGVTFHFEIAGDLLGEELLDLFNRAPAGLFQLEIGLQSFLPEALAAIGRKTDLEKWGRNLERLLRPGNIHVHLDLIAGLPFEDLQSFVAGFERAFRFRPDMLQLGFLKLLHGAEMRENPDRYPCCYSPNPPYTVLETPWMPAEDFTQLRWVEDALERLYNSGRFRLALEYLLGLGLFSSFTLFSAFGRHTASEQGVALDRYMERFYRFFSEQPGVDPDALRDAMVEDRLSTNSTGHLPPVLQRSDPALKRVIRDFERVCPRPKGVKRGYAILYSCRRFVFAEYSTCNPVSNRYPLMYYALEGPFCAANESNRSGGPNTADQL